jgi:hypothetical protein
MTEKKDLKIEFAPGAFDSFDGTQEELDALLKEIQTMFEGKSADEVKEMSRPISDEDFDELPNEIKLQLMRSYSEEDEALPEDFKRKLQ